MGVAASAWCVIGACQHPPEIVLTYERLGSMAHYGACRAHVLSVVDRVLGDLARIDAQQSSAGERFVQKVAGHINVTHESLGPEHPIHGIGDREAIRKAIEATGE